MSLFCCGPFEPPKYVERFQLPEDFMELGIDHMMLQMAYDLRDEIAGPCFPILKRRVIRNHDGSRSLREK